MNREASIGDVIRAWRELGATTEVERREIARLLSFDLREPKAPTLDPVIISATGTVAGTSTAAAVSAPPEHRPPVNGDATPLDLIPFPEIVDPPVRFPATRVLPPTVVSPAPLESLFSPSWTRAIASSLTSRMALVGAIDMPHVVALMSQRTPVRSFPRLPRRVSATEVVAAIDGTATMSWFRDDVDQLIARLDAVTRAPVTVVRCAGAPELAYVTGGESDDDAMNLVRIHAGGRVVGLSDLGFGSAWSTCDVRRARAWHAFGEQLLARGASLVIVTPTPLDRIPEDVRRGLRCVYWDRSTRPAFVHRLLRDHR